MSSKDHAVNRARQQGFTSMVQSGDYSETERRKSRRALAFIVRSQPGRTAAVIILSMLASFAEGFSIAAFIPLLGFLVDTGGGDNWLTAAVINLFQFIGLEPTLKNILLLMVGSITVKAALVMQANKEAGFAAVGATRHLRLVLLKALLRARWSYFTHLPTGRTSHAIVTETDRSSTVYTCAAQMTVAGTQTVVYLLLALAVSWSITLLAIIVTLTVFYSLGFVLRIVREAGRSQTYLLQSLSSRLVEAIGFFKPLKVMHLEESVLPLLEQESVDIELARRRIIRSSAFLKVYYEPLFAILLAIGIYASTVWFEVKFIDLIALALLFYRSGSQLVSLQRSYQALVANESVLVLVHDLIQETDAAYEVMSKGEKPKLERAITIENGSFDHGDGEILRDMNLSVAAGKITAIIGHSGSGKTTMLDLLTGLNGLTSGTVRVDETDMTRVDTAAWRKSIGYVPQESFLFHDTIEANLRLGDEEITDEDVQWALKAAGADFVDELPQGLKTLVGERGGRLSGGQRQRIALARALVRHPVLLVLDEVTSSLDSEQEKAIKKTLRKLKGRTTIIMATHRPALLTIADNVYRLQNGKVLQEK